MKNAMLIKEALDVTYNWLLEAQVSRLPEARCCTTLSKIDSNLESGFSTSQEKLFQASWH
jgi:hypothetical protein